MQALFVIGPLFVLQRSRCPYFRNPSALLPVCTDTMAATRLRHAARAAGPLLQVLVDRVERLRHLPRTASAARNPPAKRRKRGEPGNAGRKAAPNHIDQTELDAEVLDDAHVRQIVGGIGEQAECRAMHEGREQ